MIETNRETETDQAMLPYLYPWLTSDVLRTLQLDSVRVLALEIVKTLTQSEPILEADKGNSQLLAMKFAHFDVLACFKAWRERRQTAFPFLAVMQKHSSWPEFPQEWRKFAKTIIDGVPESLVSYDDPTSFCWNHLRDPVVANRYSSVWVNAMVAVHLFFTGRDVSSRAFPTPLFKVKP